MNHIAISGSLIFITSLFSVILVLTKAPKRNTSFTWMLFSLSVALWGFGLFRSFITDIESIALFWSRFLNLSAVFIPLFFFHFILCFTNKVKDKRKELFFYYIICISCFLIAFTFPKTFVSHVEPILSFKYYPKPGILYYGFALFFAYLVVYGITLLSKDFVLSSGVRKNQIKYLLFGVFVGFAGGATTFFPVFNIKIYPLGTYLVAIYVITVTYAIIKYRLMDINVALTRAGVFIVVYSLVLGVPFWLGYVTKLWLPATSLAVLFATLGPFIYIYISHRAEERLLKEQRRYQNTLKQASAGMTRIRNLRKLLDLIAHIVTKTVKIAYAGIYLYHQETNEFVLQVMRDKGRVPVPKLTPDNPLISWIMVNRQPLVYEEIKRLMEDNHDATYKHLEENMRLLTASVVIPSFLEDRFLGFFVLGEKTSGQIYTPDDLNVFQVLAAQAALAIENARFFEETRQMQEQIATAEKMATIGTMADGLSHQINNRFYALSLIAADTIDTIKMTNTSNCSPEVKEAFSQISHALERVKANVMQGGEVVKGMLKYTRKGEEGLEPLTLDQILDSTLEMVQYKVKLSEIDIIRNYPKDHPKIRGNSVQLQEAFFNFIDNGYDSTVERKTILKEPDYRGRLTFSCQAQENGMLLVTIEDNGMGIKEEDKKKLFAPFFTTKVSSRLGTGLGLYVLRRVIEEFHKGKIWFESEYKKGTRFFLQLPIAKNN